MCIITCPYRGMLHPPTVPSKSTLNSSNVIPASEARRESFIKSRKDSGQAGMTAKKVNRCEKIIVIASFH